MPGVAGRGEPDIWANLTPGTSPSQNRSPRGTVMSLASSGGAGAKARDARIPAIALGGRRHEAKRSRHGRTSVA